MRIGLHALACIVLGSAACGGGASSAGQGSSTLTVNATVRADNTVVNANTGAGFDTQFSVRVSKAGVPLSGAMVDIEGDAGKVVLTENQQTQQNQARYDGQQAGYSRTYTLGVHLGADFVENVTVTGPDLHSFSAPLLGAQAMSGQPLEVKWAASGATTATLTTAQLDHIAIPDTGNYTVPAGGIDKVDPGKTKDTQLQITRSESIVPKGALGDSSLSVGITNEITFLIIGQ
jgi:hypothetical protein